MQNKIQGLGVALVTPFDKNLAVDSAAIERILAHISNVDFLVINGSTAESMSLTGFELRQIIEIVATNFKKPIVISFSSSNTHQLSTFIKDFDFTHISAVMLSSPYYNKPCQQGLFNHFATIADLCPLPILLYNVPSRTGSNLEATTIVKLSEHANIFGIKEASGNLAQCIAISQQTKNFSLLCGDDLLTLPMISIGAKGLISTIGNCFPIETKNMVSSALNHHFDEAQKDLFRLKKYIDFISIYGNPSGTKAILAHLKFCNNYLRAPLFAIDEKKYFESMSL